MDLANETYGQYFSDDLKADESLKPYADMKGIDLINSHKELSAQTQSFQERLGKAVEPLPENATDEQKAQHAEALRTIMNVPKVPGEYKINLRDGVKADDPLLSAVIVKAHETGMSHQQMQGVYDAVGSAVTAMEKKALETTDAALKSSWGVNFDANVEKGMQTFRAVAKESGLDPDKTLDQLGHLRRSEGFMRMLANLSRHYKEAEIGGIGGGPGAGSDKTMSPVDRLAERIKARSARG